MALKIQRKRKANFRAWHAKQIGKRGKRAATAAFHTPTYWKRLSRKRQAAAEALFGGVPLSVPSTEHSEMVRQGVQEGLTKVYDFAVTVTRPPRPEYLTIEIKKGEVIITPDTARQIAAGTLDIGDVVAQPVEVADVDVANFGKDGNFGWVGSFTDPEGVVQTAYSDNTPFRTTGVKTLDALDEANNGQVSRLLKGDGTHRHMAEVITNLGFPTTESSIRRYRKKIEA